MQEEVNEGAGDGSSKVTVSGMEGEQGGLEKMTAEQQWTREEKAYWRLVKEGKEVLSEVAFNVITKADSIAYAIALVPRVDSYHLYEDFMERAFLTATGLADPDREPLAQLSRAALAAAASIDPHDETPALEYFRANRGYLHERYKLLSGMVEKILEEKTRWWGLGELSEEPFPEDYPF